MYKNALKASQEYQAFKQAQQIQEYTILTKI